MSTGCYSFFFEPTLRVELTSSVHMKNEALCSRLNEMKTQRIKTKVLFIFREEGGPTIS